MSYNVAAGILRGIGDSKTPLYFLILSSFLNIVLDLFLIVVVKLGTAGAAYATIIAQGVSALLCFIYMFRKFDILKTSREDYYLDGYGECFVPSAAWESRWGFSIPSPLSEP